MKKIRLVAIFFVSIFSFNLLVKADETYQYCQYDVADGTPYVVGDCDHYFNLIDNHNSTKSCKYQGGFNSSDLNGYDYGGVSVNNYVNFQNTCPDFLIQDNISNDRDLRPNTVGNQGYELTYAKYFPEGWRYMDYTYYCKVGSTDWCKSPSGTEYYTINQGYDSSEGTPTCMYLKGDNISLQIYCYPNDGYCADQPKEHWGADTLKVPVSKFITNGHYYCPKVKVTSAGVDEDVEKQIFNSSTSSTNETIKYCNYNELTDSNGNKFIPRLTITYGSDNKVKSIVPTVSKECAKSNCNAYFETIDGYTSDSLQTRLMACYNNHSYTGCPEVKLSGNKILIADCINSFSSNDGNTSNGNMSNNSGVGDSEIRPGTENDRYSDVETCTDVDVNHIKACGCIPAEVADITSKVYFVLRLIGPIILLIIGGFEMAKAIAAQDESAIEKAKKKLVNKFIAAAAIFLVLTIIKLAVSLVAENSPGIFECVNILLDGYVI